MRKLITVVLISTILLFSYHAWAQNFSPVGAWTTIDDSDNRPRSIVQITERGGNFSGRILKVFKRRGDTGFCHNCPGRFKGKPVKGLGIIWGVRQAGRNEWSGGRILDPKTGKIYNVKLSLSQNGKRLFVRGYIGISLFGRTQTWVRRK